MKTIATKNISDSRGTIALTKETVNKIKDFSKKNSLKMYEVIDSMADVVTDCPEFAEKVIVLTRDRAKIKDAEKEIFSQKIGKLPSELQAKLRAMSSDDLVALLEKAEL
jgi:hypothetical protein